METCSRPENCSHALFVLFWFGEIQANEAADQRSETGDLVVSHGVMVARDSKSRTNLNRSWCVVGKPEVIPFLPCCRSLAHNLATSEKPGFWNFTSPRTALIRTKRQSLRLTILVTTIKLMSSNKLLRRSITPVTCRRASNRH